MGDSSGSDRQLEESRLIESAREFAEKFVRPRSGELDAKLDPAESFDWEIFEEAHRRGLRTLAVPTEHGGAGTSVQTLSAVLMEIARGDLGVAAVMAQMNYTAALVANLGTPEQVADLMPRIIDDPRFMISVCSTELGVGSDATSGAQTARYATKAVRDGDGWRITGHKQFIDNGSLAKLYLVFAQTDDDVPLGEGSTCFMVEGGAEGLTPGRVHDKSGQRLAAHAQVHFDNVFVPETRILGQMSRGRSVFGGYKLARIILTASTAIGMAQAAYERILDWIQSRYQGDGLLIEHDPIRLVVERLRMQLDVARTYVWDVARSVDEGDDVDPRRGIYAKITAGEVAWDMAVNAVELHGGRGYMREEGVEKLLRDAASMFHAAGTDRTLLLRAARTSLKVPAAAVRRPDVEEGEVF